MADKIINLRIDVTKINKDWLFKGEKGTYLDCTLFYNEVQDSYGGNGMITQSVPKAIYEEDKAKPKAEQRKGEILGNAKVWGSPNRESIPGETATGHPNAGAATPPPANDNLPF